MTSIISFIFYLKDIKQQVITFEAMENMSSIEWKKQVLDLGDYTEISFQEAVSLKLNSLVLDEANLNRPISITLVIPTKIDVEEKETRELELKVLRDVLSECSKLVDVGFLDEIIVIDGSRDEEGKPSYNVLENVVKNAYDELGLFKEQVNLLNRYTSENIRAKKGFFDFVLTVVNQFDENIEKILAMYGVYNVCGRFGVPPGKGAGLWLAVPISFGDIICFVDSDIRDFKKEFVVALCQPILYTRTVRDSAIKYVKAYYKRLTIRLSSTRKRTFKLGGRVTRLLVKPLLKVIIDNLDEFQGLETFKYPLSGEYAMSRDVMEMLRIPDHYGIEISSLMQLHDMFGITPLAQINLGYFQHIGQSFSGIHQMSEQIVSTLYNYLGQKGIDLSDEELKDKIMSEYIKLSNEILEDNAREAELLKSEIKEITHMHDMEFMFSIDEEKERINQFSKILEDIFTEPWSNNTKRTYLPPWQMIEKETNLYFQIREMLKRRSNQSTWSRLNSVGLI